MPTMIVYDNIRTQDPKDDRRDVLGEAKTAAEAIRLAKKAQGLASVDVHGTETASGRPRTFVAQEYSDGDVAFAREHGGPDRADPWHGLRNYEKVDMAEARRRSRAAGKRTAAKKAGKKRR